MLSSRVFKFVIMLVYRGGSVCLNSLTGSLSGSLAPD
jgi:hypothetical protein